MTSSSAPGQAYYLDMVQADDWMEPGTSWAGTVPPKKTYAFEATGEVPPDLAGKLRGVQACIWSENLTTKALFNHMVFPRLSAVAEAAWTPAAAKRLATLRRHRAADAASLTEHRTCASPSAASTPSAAPIRQRSCAPRISACLRGEAIAGDKSFAFVHERDDVTVLPLLYARSTPGGPIERATYDAFKAEFPERLKAALPLDGLHLVMHGAMYVAGMEDAEGDWIAAARDIVGPDCLIAASYDLHGNVSQPIIDRIDIFAAYRTAPHIDVFETRKRAYMMLADALATGTRPGVVWAPIPVLLPGERTSTVDEPAKGFMPACPAIDAVPGILDANLMVGYVWADEPRATAAAVITGTDRDAMTREAESLARAYWDARADFAFGPETGPLGEMLDRAAGLTSRPIILADSGDNPTGGGVGDRADVLSALIARGWADAMLVGITDRPATEACFAAGQGTRLPLAIGGTLERDRAGDDRGRSSASRPQLRRERPRGRRANRGNDDRSVRPAPALSSARRLRPARPRPGLGRPSRRQVGISVTRTRRARQSQPDGADRRRRQPGHPAPHQPAPAAPDLSLDRRLRLVAQSHRLGAHGIAAGSGGCDRNNRGGVSDRQARDAAVIGRPGERLMQEALDLDESLRGQVAIPPADLEDVPPGGEVMQANAGRLERFGRIREDVVVEDGEGVGDLGAGVADRLGELDLAAAVGGQVLDQEHARALLQRALDLGVAAEALRLLAHIEHGQRQPVGQPGGEGNAGRLAARDASNCSKPASRRITEAAKSISAERMRG